MSRLHIGNSKNEQFQRKLCIKLALSLKRSIFLPQSRKEKWLRIKFYPRKHPSHVQIAHRELSGGSQRALFSSKSICQKRNSVLPFAMTLDLYSTQKLQVRKHGYQLDDSSIYLILQRLQRSKYLLLPIYWLQYSVHSLFITMFPFFHTHHTDFSINDQHFENNSRN